MAPNAAARSEPARPAERSTPKTVLAILVLQHVPHPAAFIAEIRRCLRPGGHLLIIAPARDGTPLTSQNLSWRLRAACYHRELVIEDTVLLPRAGAHHGVAVADDGDFYGTAVNLAARVANEARGGQLLVTTDVALAATDAGLMTTHVGAVELRNVSESVDIYDVRVRDTGAPVVTDPVCQMRVPTSGEAVIALDWAGRAVPLLWPALPVAVCDRPGDLPRTTTPIDPLG